MRVLVQKLSVPSSWVRGFASSSGAGAAKPETISSLKRVQLFVSNNKQALINIFGMYLVFSYSIHNYRVQIAWDEREVEFRKIEKELGRVKATLNDGEFISRTSERVKTELKQPRIPNETIARVLRSEYDLLLNPLQPTKEEIVIGKMNKEVSKGAGSPSMKTGQPDTTNAELGGLIGSIVVGGDGKSGRIV